MQGNPSTRVTLPPCKQALKLPELARGSAVICHSNLALCQKVEIDEIE